MMRILLVLLCAGLSARAFEVTTVTEQIPESNAVTRTRVTDGKTQFSFIAPKGWITSSDAAARRVSLQTTEPRATINVQFSTNAMPADLAQFRQQVTSALQNATVLEEFQAPSAGSVGFAIDVRHTINGSFNIITRMCVYKSPDGAIELSMASSPDDFEKLHTAWTWFSNSFRVEPRPASRAAPKQE
jgi:hypothetical protein